MGMGPGPAGLAGGAGRHQDVLTVAQKTPSEAPGSLGADGKMLMWHGTNCSEPAGGSRAPSLGFLMCRGCWSHVKEEIKKKKKKGKNHVSLLGVGFLLPISPLKLELLWQGKVSARRTGHPIAR